MAILRLLLVAFNVVVISFLIYRLVEVFRHPMERWKKITVFTGGILLLLAPFGIFLRFFAPTPQYFIVYPAAIFMYLYLTRQMSVR